MADDRSGDASRTPNLDTSNEETVPYKGLIGKKNIAWASLPSRHESSKGTGKWDFGGGRLQVKERDEEEMGPREMTKFDPKNKYHVAMLKSSAESSDGTEGLMLHPGGHFSFPKKEAPKKEAPQKKPTQKASEKAVAPKKEAPKKKMSNLEKARAAEAAARKSGKL